MRSWLAFAVGVAIVWSTRSPAMERELSFQVYEDIYYLPSPDALRVFSLGHRDALADMIWMRGLVYIGDEFRARGDVEHVHRYADAIIALSPDFVRVYSWACTMGLYQPQAPSLEDARRSVQYLEMAVRRFPDDGELAWSLAAAYLYELPSFTRDDALKREFRATGTEHMLIATRLGGGPPWAALTNAANLESLGRTEQAIAHLEQMYVLVEDADTREQIELRLEGLRAGATAEALRSAERDLRERARSSFAWIPLDFYVLVGERRIPRVD